MKTKDKLDMLSFDYEQIPKENLENRMRNLIMQCGYLYGARLDLIKNRDDYRQAEHKLSMARVKYNAAKEIAYESEYRLKRFSFFPWIRIKKYRRAFEDKHKAETEFNQANKDLDMLQQKYERYTRLYGNYEDFHKELVKFVNDYFGKKNNVRIRAGDIDWVGEREVKTDETQKLD